MRAYHWHDRWGVGELARAYPGLSLRPQKNGDLLITGELEFFARYRGREQISDSYLVEICVTSAFPKEAPRVKECGGRIPSSFHTRGDDSLCLGSPMRLSMTLHGRLTLQGFVEKCLIPFLYGYSYKEKHGRLPFGELAHGHKGILQDYMTLFGVGSKETCLGMLSLLGVKKRIANRRACPCGSRRRVGRCHHRALNCFRRIQSRAWFRAEAGRLSK